MVRRGLRALLESEAGVEVCEEASNGLEASFIADQTRPDVVILDLRMPVLAGPSAISEVLRSSPHSAVLVVTVDGSPETARICLTAGALGFVDKADADPELLAAVRAVRQHKPYVTRRFDADVRRSLLDRDWSGQGDIWRNVSRLTHRELEVVKMLAEGSQNKEVATKLGISRRTVDTHRLNVMKKLNFSGFSQLIRWAILKKIADPQ